jgi:hypothetical protein
MKNLIRIYEVVLQMKHGFTKAKGANEEMAATFLTMFNFKLCMHITCKTQST